MKGKTFVVKKDIVLKAGEIITQWSNNEIEYDTFSFVCALGDDHVFLPKLERSDIDEGLKSGFIEEIDTKEYLNRNKKS